MPVLPRDVAQVWIARWDRQQEGYVPHREDHFTALIDAVQAGTGRPDPLVLDLGCGPGSLSVRLLDRIPGATVVGIDTDPLLLALARASHGDRPGLRFADQDLRVPGWSGALDLGRPVDAAVSTTALHWLPEPDLTAVYRELAGVLRPGGLVLNGDDLTVKDSAPTLARLERAIQEQVAHRRFAEARPEDWQQWWEAVAAEPLLGEANADRNRRRAETRAHEGSPSGSLSIHVRALRAAGFTEIGTLWQVGDNRLLAAARP